MHLVLIGVGLVLTAALGFTPTPSAHGSVACGSVLAPSYESTDQVARSACIRGQAVTGIGVLFAFGLSSMALTLYLLADPQGHYG